MDTALKLSRESGPLVVSGPLPYLEEALGAQLDTPRRAVQPEEGHRQHAGGRQRGAIYQVRHEAVA